MLHTSISKILSNVSWSQSRTVYVLHCSITRHPTIYGIMHWYITFIRITRFPDVMTINPKTSAFMVSSLMCPQLFPSTLTIKSILVKHLSVVLLATLMTLIGPTLLRSVVVTRLTLSSIKIPTSFWPKMELDIFVVMLSLSYTLINHLFSTLIPLNVIQLIPTLILIPLMISFSKISINN